MYNANLKIVRRCVELFDLEDRNKIIDLLRQAPIKEKVEWFDKVGVSQVYREVNHHFERSQQERVNEEGPTKQSERTRRLTAKRWAQKYTLDGYTYWELITDRELGWVSVKNLRAKADGMYYKADLVEEALQHLDNGGTKEEAAEIIMKGLADKGMAPQPE